MWGNFAGREVETMVSVIGLKVKIRSFGLDSVGIANAVLRSPYFKCGLVWKALKTFLYFILRSFKIFSISSFLYLFLLINLKIAYKSISPKK
ncbi:hypothetical protein Echvi_3712 [Echinicola vietnamensis DSM 17526]|uniref:Uncharacterized protein n=1 Tax=Echinicola vietnamensis (strain DSM 17526 / LMG 23754 / KMM 6221) TaxID=926556 RepID=L0G134_ECHVK|nr:hypothetical protein Echvi_3712 [Echinicola vietnamensis DSM 17526]